MTVLFLKDYAGVYEAGDVVDLVVGLAEALIEAGYCKLQDKPKKAAPKAKAESK